ncbi:MAG: cell division protein ZapA [Marivibrio sp.]|uniref:cell division protein ZapA n=1 Tax=Marivibrio sp. TaxID=2039719 RepID=UPI0032ED2BDF
MGQITVTVNDRDYTVACEAGQEGHVASLAERLDGQVRDLAGAIGQVGHARLLLIAALMTSDELAERAQEVERLQARVAALEAAAASGGAEADVAREKAEAEAAELRARSAASLDSAARRIDAIAERLQGS